MWLSRRYSSEGGWKRKVREEFVVVGRKGREGKGGKGSWAGSTYLSLGFKISPTVF